MLGNWRIRWLLIAHVVCGILCLVVLVPSTANLKPGTGHVALAAFYAIVFCELSLLGTWAAYGRTAWWKRLIGLVAGGAYLDCMLGAAGMSDGPPKAIVASLAIAGLSRLAPKATIRLGGDQPPPCRSDGKRTSIRSLMLVTLVAALLLAATERLAESYIGILVAWSSCFLAVGLTAPAPLSAPVTPRRGAS